MIQIEHLTKAYGDRTAVEDLSVHVDPGECFAFLGPNGAGKTTTIKVIAGLLRPTRGTVRVRGHDVVNASQQAKAKMAYVPDQPYLYDKLSGREFLKFVADMYGIGRDAMQQHLARFGKLFGLDEYLDDLCESYSHGMKQRVVLTAALLHDPEVLVVDEPMVGLDPRGSRLVKDLFREHVDRGRCVFLSTHSLAVAEEVADRIGIITRGRLVALGNLADLEGQCGGAKGLEAMFLRITEADETPAEDAEPCPPA